MRTEEELRQIAFEVVQFLSLCMGENGEQKALDLGILITEEKFKQLLANNEKTLAYAIRLSDGRVIDTPYMEEIREEMKRLQ